MTATCDHLAPQPVRRRDRLGRFSYWHQCAECGRFVRALKLADVIAEAGSLEVADADEDGPRRADQFEGDRARERLEEEKRLKREEWRDAASIYYVSDEWREKRDRVIRRAGGICEGCGIKDASQVHHVSYEHFGNEMLWELRAICRTCHESLHEHMQDQPPVYEWSEK